MADLNRKEKLGNILGICGLLIALIGLFLYGAYPEKAGLISAFEAVALASLVYYFVLNFTRISAFSKKRSTRMGTGSFVTLLLFLGILGIIAVLGTRHHFRYDLSESGDFSLSPQTKKILKETQKEIKITAFLEEAAPDLEKAKDLLNNFKYQSSKISYEMVDPVKRPTIAKRYGVTQSGTMILESGGKESRTRAVSEEELVNAIIRMNQEKKKTVYFLEGHGEHKISDTEKEGYSIAKSGLEKDGFVVKNILLLQEGKVPDDAAVLVIGGPVSAFLPAEKSALETWLSKGGKVIFMVDPETRSGLDDLLEKYGILLHKDLVIDPRSKLMGADFTIPVVSEFPRHEITKEMKAPVFFPVARSFDFIKEKGSEIDFQALAMSDPGSWGETKIQTGTAKFDQGEDFPGPLVMAAVFSFKDTGKMPAKWIMVGDSDFITNNFFQAFGNGDFFLNMVSYLAEEKNLISIRPNPVKSGTLLLTSRTGIWFFLVPVIIIPGVVLLAGILVWRKRRNR
ncbi:MAG TPA: Gldg family protein [Nitrospiria bacterium]|nr:Gldg family protein [Nitrospiria bacterium]